MHAWKKRGPVAFEDTLGLCCSKKLHEGCDCPTAARRPGVRTPIDSTNQYKMMLGSTTTTTTTTTPPIGSRGPQFLLLLLLACCVTVLEGRGSTAYVLFPPNSSRRTRLANSRSFLSPLLSANNDDDNGGDGGGGDNSNNSRSILQELKARLLEFDEARRVREQKWRNADCASGRRVVVPDWIRRIDVDYPLVACGSARGRVYVSNLETGAVVAAAAATTTTTSASPPPTSETDDDRRAEEQRQQQQQQQETDLEGLDHVLNLLYGSHDGGGTLAIAFSGDTICVSNRQGGVQIYRLDVSSEQLVSQGTIGPLRDKIVTCLHLDEEHLWVAAGNGTAASLQAYPLDVELPLALQSKPELQWEFRSPITSMHFDEELGCGVIATANGCVELVSMEDDSETIGSLYPPFDSGPVRRASIAYPMSVTLTRNRENDADEGTDADGDDGHGACERVCYSIACGGNDGSIWIQALNLRADGTLNEEKPFDQELRQLTPSHVAPVKCLAAPIPGLLVSGGLDGTMRIWDINDRESLYQFVGYKVWLGSLWTDGTKLVSDGSDNSVIMHDFDKDYEELKGV